MQIQWYRRFLPILYWLWRQTVRELAVSLTADKIDACLSKAKYTKLALHLPKFIVEYSMDMNDILVQMGLIDAFDEKAANFTAIGRSKSGENLYISQVLQKVKVMVDEKGIEAAAITEVAMCMAAGVLEEEKPLEISFDKPFVYLIANTRMESYIDEQFECMPVFMGMVTEF